jgi:hypothetical protein
MHIINVRQIRNRNCSEDDEAPQQPRRSKNVTWSARGRVKSTRLASIRPQPRRSNMRIEELILEGFKSYPVRTQITGWDPSFNAITGLNGSGKSNILDAICFVLGLTNMSSVRVLHILSSSIYPLTMFPFSRCVRKTNRISSISVVRPASPRHRSQSSLIIRTGKAARLEWKTTLRSQ